MIKFFIQFPSSIYQSLEDISFIYQSLEDIQAFGPVCYHFLEYLINPNINLAKQKYSVKCCSLLPTVYSPSQSYTMPSKEKEKKQKYSSL